MATREVIYSAGLFDRGRDLIALRLGSSLGVVLTFSFIVQSESLSIENWRAF